jgi:tetraacyldisaccharide 4'-kinase
LVSDGKRILADAKTSGDEPFLLAQQLLNIAAVIADKNRVKAGIWARENLGVTAFVLDDGFQHLRLKRSLDIVTIDATNPFGNGKLLPAGTLRENTISLKRADCIVITRADLSTEIENLKSQISTYNANCPIFLANTRIVDLKPLAEYLEQLSIETRQAEARIQNLKSQSVFAFCALGNPNGFFDHLHHSGFNLLAAKRFPDHYAYTQKDIESLENSAQEKGINILLTTAKDAVKLSALKLNLPYFVVEIEIEFDDEKHLNELLQAIRLQNKV